MNISEIYNREKLFENLSPGTGIVLIGTSDRGPSMVPVKAINYTQVARVFGEESQLANAFVEAYTNGGQDIYLVRINGTHRRINVQNVITLVAVSADDESLKIRYSIIEEPDGSRYMTIINSKIGYSKTYYLNGKSLSQLVNEINIDALSIKSPVYAVLNSEGSTDTLYQEDFRNPVVIIEGEDGEDPIIVEDPFLGGSEMDNQDFMGRIEQVLTMLEAYPICQVGIVCDSFNSANENGYLYQILSNFAKDKVRCSQPCMVTVGIVFPKTNNNQEAKNNAEFIYEAAERFITVLNLDCQVSEYINVVIAKPSFSRTHPSYTSNGVAAYCGMLHKSYNYDGTTNQVVNDADDEKSFLTDEQKERLSQLGYVTFSKVRKYGVEQVRVLRGVNLVKSVKEVINPDYIRELPLSTTNQPIVRKIPSLLSSSANVAFVQNLGFALNEIFDVDTRYNVTTLQWRIEEILRRFSDIIKESRIDVKEIIQGYVKWYIVNIDVIPVGEIETISIGVRVQ
jgi:hypothetical protein